MDTHSIPSRVVLLSLLVLLGLYLSPSSQATTETALSPPSPEIRLDPAPPIYAGEPLTMSAELPAADPSQVEYQFLLDGVVIQPWSPQAFCQRVMTLDELGLHEVTVQVRDDHGQVQQETEIYVVRRPFWPNSDMPPGLAMPVSQSVQHDKMDAPNGTAPTSR